MNPDELSVMQIKTCSEFTISVPEEPARFAQGGQQKHRPISKKNSQFITLWSCTIIANLDQVKDIVLSSLLTILNKL